MRKFFVLPFALAMALCVTACGGSNGGSPDGSVGSAENPIIFACAHVDPEDSVIHQEMLKFKEYVETNTDSRVDVHIFPNGQMGGERECVEAVEMGSLQMTAVTASVMSAYHEKFNLMELPFLFSDYDAVYDAYDGRLGEIFNGWMEDQNLRSMGMYCAGMRGISNNVKPIYTPDDLRGLKIRCIESPMFMTLFKLLGTNPTPMSYNEVYTGLEQGTIDGQDNPATLTYSSKFYEKLKYFTATNHVALCVPIVVQNNYYANLPDDIRTVMDEGFAIMIANCREAYQQFEQEAIASMEESGIACTTLTDEQMQLFKDAVAPIYDQYREIVGGDVMDLTLSY